MNIRPGAYLDTQVIRPRNTSHVKKNATTPSLCAAVVMRLSSSPSHFSYPIFPLLSPPAPSRRALVPWSLCGPLRGECVPLSLPLPHHHVFIVSISLPAAVTPIFCSFTVSRESATSRENDLGLQRWAMFQPFLYLSVRDSKRQKKKERRLV